MTKKLISTSLVKMHLFNSKLLYCTFPKKFKIIKVLVIERGHIIELKNLPRPMHNSNFSLSSILFFGIKKAIFY